MITGAAKVAGVVGWPVAHSLSPLIHNAWIEALGLDAAYVPFAIRPEGFAQFVEAASIGRWLAGVNVTVPHKLTAYRAADAVSEAARLAGAANVLVLRSEGGVFADNTDGAGLLSAFAEQAPDWCPSSGPVLLLGAGGAAVGALAALVSAGAPHVRIAARRPDEARWLAGEWAGAARVDGCGFDELGRALEDVTAVINATSAGLQGAGGLPPMNAAPTSAVFMDMVYAPLRTPFLKAAAARGHSTVDGLAMLIGQARPSFESFFGVVPPLAEAVDVRSLCLRALGEA